MGPVIFLMAGCFHGPLYEAGMASDEASLGASLTPPSQEEKDYWKMEKDIRLFHFSKGNGKNILFIHGGPGIPSNKTYPGLDLLTGSYKVHYYHQRGCGKSSRPFQKFESGNFYKNMNELVRRLGLRAHLADIERVRVLLGEDRLILIGHSFGAFLATLYAAEFPDHVEKLVLVNPADVLQIPPPSGGLYGIIEQKLPEKRIPAFQEYLSRLMDFGSVFSKTETELSHLQNEFIPYFQEAARASGLPSDISLESPNDTGGFSVVATYFDLGEESDFRPFLNQVKVPTLILYGDLDLFPETSFSGFSRIRKSRMVKIHGAGHFPFIEKSNDFARTVRTFLEEK